MGLSDLRRDMGFTVTTPEDLAAESPIEALLGKVMNLETAKSPQTKRPKRHQPLTLLWALGRAARAEPRLVSWETTRAEIGSLISTFGLVDDAPNPEYPVLKLTHFGLWEMAGHPAPPAASGGEPLRWMRRHQPLSGPGHRTVTAREDAARSHVPDLRNPAHAPHRPLRRGLPHPPPRGTAQGGRLLHPPPKFRTVMCTGSSGDERFSDGRARTKQAGASTRWLTGM